MCFLGIFFQGLDPAWGGLQRPPDPPAARLVRSADSMQRFAVIKGVTPNYYFLYAPGDTNPSDATAAR